MTTRDEFLRALRGELGSHRVGVDAYEKITNVFIINTGQYEFSKHSKSGLDADGVMLSLAFKDGQYTAEMTRYHTNIAKAPGTDWGAEWWNKPRHAIGTWGGRKFLNDTEVSVVLEKSYPEILEAPTRYYKPNEAEKRADAERNASIAATLETDPAFTRLCERFTAKGGRVHSRNRTAFAAKLGMGRVVPDVNPQTQDDLLGPLLKSGFIDLCAAA